MSDTQHDPREVEALADVVMDALQSDGESTTGQHFTRTCDVCVRGARAVARMVLSREARLVDALEFAVNRLRGQVNIPPLVDEGALHGICRNVADDMASGLAAHRAATKPSEPVKPETLAEAVEHFLDVWDAQEGRIPVDEMRAALKRAQASDTSEGRARERSRDGGK